MTSTKTSKPYQLFRFEFDGVFFVVVDPTGRICNWLNGANITTEQMSAGPFHQSAADAKRVASATAQVSWKKLATEGFSIRRAIVTDGGPA